MQCFHLLLFGVRIDALHALFGLVPAALHAKPPWRVRHVRHADRERDSRDDGGGEHRPPAPTCREEDVVQDGGTIIDDAPTAIPTMIRNTTNSSRLGASAVRIAPSE